MIVFLLRAICEILGGPGAGFPVSRRPVQNRSIPCAETLRNDSFLAPGDLGEIEKVPGLDFQCPGGIPQLHLAQFVSQVQVAQPPSTLSSAQSASCGLDFGRAWQRARGGVRPICRRKCAVSLRCLESSDVIESMRASLEAFGEFGKLRKNVL